MFYIFVFCPYIRTSLFPISISKLIAQLLGAKIGHASFSSGIMYDHFAVRIGKNTMCGQSSIIYAHAMEGRTYSISPITIGSNVTIGANAIVMSGTIIEDGCILAAGSVLTKNKHMRKDEIWGGVPAKKIGSRL